MNLTELKNYELIDLLHKVTTEVKQRFGQAEAAIPKAEPAKLSQRDKAIKLAKESIEFLKNENGFYNYSSLSVIACFYINREKRIVTCLLKGYNSRKIRSKATAKCEQGDVFNEYIGKAIALYRALGKPVPKLLLESPKPEEVRVGDIVNWRTGQYKSYKILNKRYYKDNNCEYLFKSLHSDWQGWLDYKTSTIIDKVIDDTRN